MSAEPMKCANCGGPIWETAPWVWVHLKEDGPKNYDLGEKRCGSIATPPLGIKSGDIKPAPERPALPTSREWLAEDGQKYRDGNWCAAEAGNGLVCCRTMHSDGWHAALGSLVFGRWYDGGPFVAAI